MGTWPSFFWGMEGQSKEWEESLSTRVGSRGIADTQISHISHINEELLQSMMKRTAIALLILHLKSELYAEQFQMAALNMC